MPVSLDWPGSSTGGDLQLTSVVFLFWIFIVRRINVFCWEPVPRPRHYLMVLTLMVLRSDHLTLNFNDRISLLFF